MDAFYRSLIRQRYLVTLLLLALVAAATYGAQKLVFKSEYRVFFGKDNPQLQTLERMQQTFVKSDNVLFILVPKSGSVFNSETLKALDWLTEQGWQLPYSTRVDSITNYQHTFAEADDLVVEDLVLDAATLSEDQIAQIKEIALNEPLLVHRLVSTDGSVAAVNVSIHFPGINLVEETPEVVTEVRNIRDQLLQRYPDLDVYLTGMVMMNNAFSEASLNDSKTLVPLMFLAVMVLIGVLIRTIGGLLATLVIIVTSITGAMGLAGWSGMYLTAPSASAPIIILTLAVADCVHILSTFYHEMRSGVDRKQALITSLRINTQPVILTSATTAIGFLSMNFSDSPPFADLGNIVAMGVMFACILSLTLFPALLAILPLKAQPQEQNNQTPIDRVAQFVIGNKRVLLWASLAVMVVTISQIPRNELNDNFVEYFDHSIPFRVATDFSNEHLTGLAMMEFELSADKSGGISDPEFLRDTDLLVQWLRQQPETVHVDSLTDTMKRLNRNMHGDDPDYYRLPESRELAAQYLLLYEMSLPYGLDLNNQINIDKSAIRLVASFHTLSSNQMLDLEQRAYTWMEANTPAIKGIIASPPLMFSHIGKRNIESMLIGTLTALVLISALLGFALRSLKLGILSLAPNLIPAGIAFGIWGIGVGEVGLALSVVTAMTLGIVVDDTVHFLSKYLYARRQRGNSTQDAIQYAFQSVGKALWITTVVLSAGFMVLSLSSFKLNADMGLLTAITIVIALIVDFILLPILIMLFDSDKEPSAGKVSSAGIEPSAGKEPSADQAPGISNAANRIHTATLKEI